jgi:uncharacterized protein (TIGR02594 family)
MNEKPIWLVEAEKFIGLKEISGPKNNSTVVDFWKRIHLSGISNDEVPWCAAFVGAVLENVGMKSTRSGLAKSYLNWGIALKTPALGSIVVFTRKGGGHVGFVVGKDKNGNLYVLGGNQSDAVNIKLFKTDNVVGYRWPSSDIKTSDLPVLASAADFETKVT